MSEPTPDLQTDADGAWDQELFAGPDWQLPAPGTVLIEPHGPQLNALLHEGARRADGWKFCIGGVPVLELRRLARQEALQAAASFARRFGLWPGPSKTPTYLAVTGHQPLLVHPGVWIKHALVDALAARYEDVTALNVVVDYDTASEFGVWVPWRAPSGELERRFIRLVPLRYGQPFSQAPAPDPSALQRFAEEVGQALDSLGAEGQALRARLDAFVAVARVGQEAAHLAEWATVVRHAWEQATAPPVRYLEVPMEALAGGEAFLRLFAHIALDASRFVPLYNQVLSRYRRFRRLRSRANPFPDLAVRGSRAELPFWVLQPGERRRALHVERIGSALHLFTADGPLAVIPLPSGATSPGQSGGATWGPQAQGGVQPGGGPGRGEEGVGQLQAAAGTADGGVSRAEADAVVDFIRSRRLQIRPRAAALTLFLRLLVADLFVHGIGGARYDRVTDALARLYLGVTLAPFAVASMSLPLPLAWPAEAEEVGLLKQRLREMRFNPQRHVGELLPGSPEAAQAEALAREKEKLVAAIRQPGAPKRELTRRIEAVNARLAALLSPVAEKIEARLRRAERAVAERQAVQFREYPFFLYEREPVWRAALEAVEGSRLSVCGRLETRAEGRP